MIIERFIPRLCWCSTSVVKWRHSWRLFSSVKKKDIPFDDLIVPIDVHASRSRSPASSIPADQVNFDGVEEVDQAFITSTLEKLYANAIIRELAGEQHMSRKLFRIAFESFRRHCAEPEKWDAALRITFSDIKRHGQSGDTLFPHFLAHAQRVFPHLACMEELKVLSDMTQPHQWYPEARAIERKVIYHAGPTNSGKTHAALEAFKSAASGQYAGPLRLLAAEIYRKMNAAGVVCDLATGEDRRYAIAPDTPAPHIAMTVEMMSVRLTTELTVIDEIQMLRDESRGFSWTRALLGAASSEVHLCGEESAIPIVKKMLEPLDEEVDVRRYERLSPLVMSTHGLRDIRNVQDGDCLVAFNRRTIFALANQLRQEQNRDVAIIFGALPPVTKLEQAQKFNDPVNPCKVLLATDAVGMGINLNIHRVIFCSLLRRNREMIPAYHAQQIAGRAGRFRHRYEKGEVMAMKDEDNDRLAALIAEQIPDVAQAGIAPGWEQLEMFSLHLPNASFVNLIDIFLSISKLHPHYFSCGLEHIRKMAVHIEHIPNLPLRDRYNFCLVPVDVTRKVLLSLFVKGVRRYADNQLLTYDWLHHQIYHLLQPARDMEDLMPLNDAYDAVVMYLWLSYKFPNHFIDADEVRKLEEVINKLVNTSLTRLIDAGGLPTGRSRRSMPGPV